MLLNDLHSDDNIQVYSYNITQQLINICGLDNVPQLIDRLYVNWKSYATERNTNNGRLPLFAAAEGNLNLGNGIGHILQANRAAIEEVDPVTGLEAFRLAAVGSDSKLESVYTLLQDYPAAINPHVGFCSRIVLIGRKRKSPDE